VRLGDNAARIAYAVLVLLPFALLALAILDGHPAVALAILALVPALNPLKTVLSGPSGQGLIPPIKSTGLTGLAFAALMGLGLALSWDWVRPAEATRSGPGGRAPSSVPSEGARLLRTRPTVRASERTHGYR